VFRVKDLLGDALASLVGPRRAKQAAVLEAWPEVVGTSRARHTQVAGIRGKVLVVTTDLPALSYELGLRREALVGALNQKAGGPTIDEIEIVLCPPGASAAGDG
jgi:predicted nucleic acid-binding Zn ribbon protein